VSSRLPLGEAAGGVAVGSAGPDEDAPPLHPAISNAPVMRAAAPAQRR
jgi:hypothetical protein